VYLDNPLGTLWMWLIIRMAAHRLVVQPAESVGGRPQPRPHQQPPDLQAQLLLRRGIKDQIVVPGGKGLRWEVRRRGEGEGGKGGGVVGQLLLWEGGHPREALPVGAQGGHGSRQVF
ncbi:MAG: hypothetical protein ACK56I_22740, partial [bacterium]